MEQALKDFTSVLLAFEQRISHIEEKFSKLSSDPVETPVETPVEIAVESCAESSIEVLDETPVEIAVESMVESIVEASLEANVEGETLVNLDAFSGDTIQNELWQTFKQISDSGMEVIVTYSGEGPRNIIVYASEETQPVYRNSSSGELRIIQAIEGTLIATLQAGESVKTARVDGVWSKIE